MEVRPDAGSRAAPKPSALAWVFVVAAIVILGLFAVGALAGGGGTTSLGSPQSQTVPPLDPQQPYISVKGD